MSAMAYEARRANLEDLSSLKRLWEAAGLGSAELERHLTEFQIVLSPEGNPVGALGLRIQGREGILHAEALADPASDDVRQQLWSRMTTLAGNHGLYRVWTRERAAFWSQQGFADATVEQVEAHRDVLGEVPDCWRVLVLREESSEAISLEREFELYRQMSRQDTEQILSQAKQFRVLAYVVGTGVFLVAMILGVYLLMRWMRGGAGP